MIPFIIVGMPRTGSTLLLTGISQHPETQVYGELFHASRSERAGSHVINRDGKQIFFDETKDDAIAFLDEHVFHADDTAFVVGFKVFAELVSCPGTEKFFLRLKEHYPTLRVIHIFRKNYLDVLVSREVATKTREWVRYANAKTTGSTSPKIAIDPVRAERFFKGIRSADNFFGGFFEPSRYLRVDYDALSQNFASTMKDVYNFLDLTPFDPTVKLSKQINQPSAVIVENYYDLCKYFQGTTFSSFFENLTVASSSPDAKGGVASLPQVTFESDNLMRIGEFLFDLDASAAVKNKHSENNQFILMKRKGLINEYLETFRKLNPQNMLELGIRRGGSMAFYNLVLKPKVHIGIELEEGTILPLDRLAKKAAEEGRCLEPIFGFDQSDKARLVSTLRNIFPSNNRPMDTIIDDASHRLEPSIASFEALFPFLREGGLYAIEDWGWAHWQGFQGPHAYMADQSALTNLIFQLLVLHTCRPDIIRQIRVTPVVVFVERGPTELQPESFRISDHLITRGRPLPNM